MAGRHVSPSFIQCRWADCFNKSKDRGPDGIRQVGPGGHDGGQPLPGGLDHRQDAGLQGLGEVGPRIHHGGQVGVIVTTD